ncbi:MAG TPA: hypothetical protein VNG12_21325, partial [Acidimicrobiales bacterium]|nr:hypothetical protein [Acidimicrobiales bacterium]
MRRNSRTTLGAIGGGVVLAAALFAGLAPAGAGAASSSAKTAAAVPTSTKSTPAATTAGSNPLAPLASLPISINLPITLLNNVIGGNALPNQ